MMGKNVLFVLFFLSGFCGLLYQVVWTRMAFASFGIITPVLSVVISVFMLGLSLGAWAGGRWIEPLARRTRCSAIIFYALAEFIIGLGAFAVPRLFSLGEDWLLSAGQANSVRYLFLSAVTLAFSILPWCLLMGTTFPLMMAFVRERDSENSESFSYLYLANVIGAMAGTSITAVILIETLGFRHTLWVAATLNFTIAGISCRLGGQQNPGTTAVPAPARLTTAASASRRAGSTSPGLIKWILFATGFIAMAMEVVWTRAFTPVLKTQVYSFALVVFFYLGATAFGSFLYRRNLRANAIRSSAQLVTWLAVTALLPILANDPRFLKESAGTAPHPLSAFIVLLSICPLCAVLGYLTPSLVDEYAAGAPEGAGKAYAINVLGCILGPLLASYLLLPWLGERTALIMLALPFLAFYFVLWRTLPARKGWSAGFATAVVLGLAVFFSGTHEDHMRATTKNAVIRRDHVASVLVHGEALDKHLLVNGMGMTHLTPITKFMVHLPLAFHEGPPDSALIICFGMGTSYRAALSWGLQTTAVELVPSVKESFGFFHEDAARFLTNGRGRIVVDDGRRFLKRTREKFDVIVVDPPPPPAAAGSSLLYSEEFYQLAKEHLKPNGIIQAWFPGASDETLEQAVLRSVYASFPYVRRFSSLEKWGTHFLASMAPIPARTADELAARMPPEAQADLLEWSAAKDLPAYLNRVLARELPVASGLNTDTRVRISDDRPFNEYFLIRRWGILSFKTPPTSTPALPF